MDLEDLLIPAKKFKSEKWQLGSLITDRMQEGGIALIFCSDFRGHEDGSAEVLDYFEVRRELYKLSKLDFSLPVCDLGALISGKSHADTHFVLQELLLACFKKDIVPIVIGGSNDLSYSLFSALNLYRQNLTYTQISNIVSLAGNTGEISEKNFLTKIFSDSSFSLKNYHHLAYQKHLNEVDSVRLMKEVDFDVVRLAEMMNSTENTEHFFRRADLVTVNCDAVESFSGAFSVSPQVNGLNRREICAYMKEVGLSENLASAGIFNFNSRSASQLNHQLLAQMIWHMVEGINIQRSHPKERQFETFWIMSDDTQYAFQRDSFSGLWYFGSDENRENLIPCSRQEYEAAIRGDLPARLFKSTI